MYVIFFLSLTNAHLIISSYKFLYLRKVSFNQNVASYNAVARNLAISQYLTVLDVLKIMFNGRWDNLFE